MRKKGAFGEQVAREVGNSEADYKGVHGYAGAEDSGHNDLSRQAGEAAE